MSVIELTDDRKEDWNAFVFDHPDGTFFHQAEWKEILERSFDFKAYFAMELSSNNIKGVLPLALVRRPIFGSAFISNPLCVYGGGLGESIDLETWAIEKAKSKNAGYIELRGGVHHKRKYLISDHFFTFRRVLSSDHDKNLKAIPRKQRAEIRKGMNANLRTLVNQDIDLFYKIYAVSVRNLGTPVFPKKYIENLINLFGNKVEITTVYHQDQPLSSVLSFQYKDQILPYYGGGLPAARQYSAYPYMYWKVMERAVEKGLRIFDFGRSIKGTGAFAFKKNFGFTSEALPYYYYLIKSDNKPNMDPNSSRNKVLTSLWKNIPLPVANRLGPVLYPIIV